MSDLESVPLVERVRALEAAVGALSVSGEAPAMEERVRRIKTKMAEDQYNVNAAPPKEPPAPTITYKDVNVAPAQEPLKGPSNEGKGLSGSNLSSSDKLPKLDIRETRSVEDILSELLVMWGDKPRTWTMLSNALRLYRSEKEASARRYEEVWECADSRRISMEALRAERDEARKDNLESLALYRANRARLEAERDDLAKRIERTIQVLQGPPHINCSCGACVSLYRNLAKIERGDTEGV